MYWNNSFYPPNIMHALRMTTKKTMRFNTDKHKNDITTLFLAKRKLYQFTLYTQRNCSLFHSNNIVRLLIRTNYIGFNVLSMLLLLLFFFHILYLACEKQIEIWHMRLFAHIEFFHNESHRISIETADIPIKRHINWKWPKNVWLSNAYWDRLCTFLNCLTIMRTKIFWLILINNPIRWNVLAVLNAFIFGFSVRMDQHLEHSLCLYTEKYFWFL